MGEDSYVFLKLGFMVCLRWQDEVSFVENGVYIEDLVYFMFNIVFYFKVYIFFGNVIVVFGNNLFKKIAICIQQFLKVSSK